MHKFEAIPQELDGLRAQLSAAMAEGVLAVCWLIAKLVIRYGPAAITIIEILLVQLGVRGGIQGLATQDALRQAIEASKAPENPTA